MPRTAIPVDLEMTRLNPMVKFDVNSDGTSFASSDGAVIEQYTRDDILIMQASVSLTVTLGLNPQAEGRTNAKTAAISSTARYLILPLRLFPPRIFGQDDGDLNIDINTGTGYCYLIRAVRPLRGGWIDGATSPGSRDQLTETLLDEIGDSRVDEFTTNVDTITAGTDAYVGPWSGDDLIFFDPTGATTFTCPVNTSNPIGRTNDEQVSQEADHLSMLHCGLLDPELFDQGGLLHLDVGAGSMAMTHLRARHIW